LPRTHDLALRELRLVDRGLRNVEEELGLGAAVGGQRLQLHSQHAGPLGHRCDCAIL